jgi:hypothetical protein
MKEGLIFILRALFIVIIWAFFWQLIEPKTKQARLLRAGLLLAGLLFVLIVVRFFGF